MKTRHFILVAALMAIVPMLFGQDSKLKNAPYPFGAAINVSTLRNNETYRQTVIDEMSSVTAENAMKMSYLSLGRRSYSWDNADYFVDFAVENGLRIHGHTLIWFKNMPSWITNFSGSTDDWKLLMKEYIQDVVGRYKGKITSWDVVNEVITDDGNLRDCIWLQKIGEEYIELAFRYAHEVDPDAILFYNDYGHEYSQTKRTAINNLVADLLSKGTPIHGLGLQMHTRAGRTQTEIANAINTAAQMGLMVHVSEIDVALNRYSVSNFTVTDELLQQQADVYKAAAETMLMLPQHQQYGITMWGVSDANSWLYANPDWPLLFDTEYQRKDVYNNVTDFLDANYSQYVLPMSNFENGTYPDCFRPNSSQVSVVDNPAKSGLNPSNKVFKMTGSGGSGIVMLDLWDGGQLIDVSAYDKLQFKYYRGNIDNSVVKIDLNGNSSNQIEPINQPSKTNTWETLEFDLTPTRWGKFTIRLNLRTNGASSADEVFIDDVKFFKSSSISQIRAGNAETSLDVSKNIYVKENAHCYQNSSDGNTILYLQLEKDSYVKADLLNMNGVVVKTINNGQLSGGDNQISFVTENKGFYIVRILINGEYSESVKLIVK